MRFGDGDEAIVYREEFRKIEIAGTDRRAELRAKSARAKRQERMEVRVKESGAKDVGPSVECAVPAGCELIVVKGSRMGNEQARFLLIERQRRIDGRQRREQPAAASAAELIALHVQKFDGHGIERRRRLSKGRQHQGEACRTT